MKELLIANIDKIHTTDLGLERIKRNINSNHKDIINILKEKINDDNCIVYKKGKNYYCENDNYVITVNSLNYCIITAHLIKKDKI